MKYSERFVVGALFIWSIGLVGCVANNGKDSSGAGSMSTDFGAMVEGVATYYDFADGTGACMLDASPNDMNVAALNIEQWDNSGWCGSCADISGPNGSVTVRIVDQCPGCDYGHLDLSPQAFDQIADLSAGRVDISWKFVPCDVTGPVSYKYKDGSNAWWTAIQVRNHRLPVTSLEWSVDGSRWTEAARTDYNYYLDGSGVGETAIQVRITAVDGQTLEDELLAVQSELEVSGGGQFQ